MAKTTPSHDTTRTSDVLREVKQAPQRHDEFGQEVLNPQPMQPPLGYKKTLSLAEQIRQQVRLHQLELADDAISETDEEADDFEIGEDYEPLSKYENDHIPTVKQLKEKAAAINKKIREANNKKAIEEHEAKKAAIKPAASPATEAPSLPTVKTEA